MNFLFLVATDEYGGRLPPEFATQCNIMQTKLEAWRFPMLKKTILSIAAGIFAVAQLSLGSGPVRASGVVLNLGDHDLHWSGLLGGNH